MLLSVVIVAAFVVVGHIVSRSPFNSDSSVFVDLSAIVHLTGTNFSGDEGGVSVIVLELIGIVVVVVVVVVAVAVIVFDDAAVAVAVVVVVVIVVVDISMLEEAATAAAVTSL